MRNAILAFYAQLKCSSSKSLSLLLYIVQPATATVACILQMGTKHMLTNKSNNKQMPLKCAFFRVCQTTIYNFVMLELKTAKSWLSVWTSWMFWFRLCFRSSSPRTVCALHTEQHYVPLHFSNTPHKIMYTATPNETPIEFKPMMMDCVYFAIKPRRTWLCLHNSYCRFRCELENGVRVRVNNCQYKWRAHFTPTMQWANS